LSLVAFLVILSRPLTSIFYLLVVSRQISRLYSQILSAEEANKAVEDSLSYIESQQAELGNLLDGYETQANEMFEGAGGRGGTVGLDFGPADGEREKA